MDELSCSEIKLFKTIFNFVAELNEYTENYNLLLYVRLLEKTEIENVMAVRKHNTVFIDFCANNEKAIIEMNKDNLSGPVKYSEKVFIELNKILEKMDKQSENTVWQHMLTIFAIIKPDSDAKEMLKNTDFKRDSNKDFIKDVIEQVEGTIDINEDTEPISAAMQLMGSGVFQNLVGNLNNGMKDGSINPQDMISSLQNILGSLSNQFNEKEKTRPHQLLD